jgi:hypothetical protein
MLFGFIGKRRKSQTALALTLLPETSWSIILALLVGQLSLNRDYTQNPHFRGQ